MVKVFTFSIPGIDGTMGLAPGDNISLSYDSLYVFPLVISKTSTSLFARSIFKTSLLTLASILYWDENFSGDIRIRDSACFTVPLR